MNVNTQHGGAVLLAKSSALVFGAPSPTSAQLLGLLMLLIFAVVALLSLSEPLWNREGW